MNLVETHRIEFKQKLTKELEVEREVVSFLNSREGGRIYIGIADNGTVIGVEDADGDSLKAKDRILKNILPSPLGLFDIQIEDMEEKRVIMISIATGSEKPYYWKKYGMTEQGCHIRVGTACQPMNRDMIEDLFSHRVRRSLRNVPSPMQDLTFRQLKIYYDEHGLNLNENFLKSLQLLTDDGKPNYIAFLLADNNSMPLKLAKYAGTDRTELIASTDYGFCSILKATDSVLGRMDIENEIRTEKTYPYRINKPMWNTKAMREIVINAIVHNDYFNEVPPKFEIFSDRVEITSAGRLPEGLSKEEFFSGVSNPRNKELMRIFCDLDMVEALGSGMPLIVRTIGKESFVFMDNYIRIVIKFDEAIAIDDDQSKAKNVEHGVKVSEVQYKILKTLQNEPKMTLVELGSMLGLSRSGIKYNIDILQTNGLLQRKGSKKDGYWFVVISNFSIKKK